MRSTPSIPRAATHRSTSSTPPTRSRCLLSMLLDQQCRWSGRSPGRSRCSNDSAGRSTRAGSRRWTPTSSSPCARDRPPSTVSRGRWASECKHSRRPSSTTTTATRRPSGETSTRAPNWRAGCRRFRGTGRRRHHLHRVARQAMRRPAPGLAGGGGALCRQHAPIGGRYRFARDVGEGAAVEAGTEGEGQDESRLNSVVPRPPAATIEHMFDALQRLVSELAAIVAELDPDLVPASRLSPCTSCSTSRNDMLRLPRRCFVRRVDDVQQWRRSGYATVAEYLAAKSGSTVGAAKTLATSTKLVSLPVLRDAMRAGKLSASQAMVITDAAAAAPSQQSRLIDQAQRSSVKELRDACLDAKAAADRDREVTNRRIHSERYVRTWTDAEGAWNFHARGTAADGARVESRLRLIDEEFDAARNETSRGTRRLRLRCLRSLVGSADGNAATDARRCATSCCYGSISRPCSAARHATASSARSPASVPSRSPRLASC